MALPVAVAMRTIFAVFGCLMVATLIYTVATDGLPFRKELLTPWLLATLIDFYINVFALAAWVIYKESNWISSIFWVFLLVCLGSITTCGYIVLQFLKLSSQESSQDPIYFVLLRHPKKNELDQRWKLSVTTAKVLFIALGCLILGTLVYTSITDGSPFRIELFTPWMDATLIDFYINVFALSVWLAYKESSWTWAFFWIVLLICFGSIITCTYIVVQLFYLSSQDPVYLILFNSSSWTGNRYERTLPSEH